MSQVFSVLIVDNDADDLKIIANSLTSKFPEIEVQLATSGHEALLTIQKGIPELMITQLQMPGLNGFALLRHLRRHPATKSIPIIVTSQLADMETVRLAMELGADDFIVKPMDFQLLAIRLAQLLQRRRQGLTLREGFRCYQRKAFEAPIEILFKVVSFERDGFVLHAPAKASESGRYSFNVAPLWEALHMMAPEEPLPCRITGSEEKLGGYMNYVTPMDRINQFEQRVQKITENPALQRSTLRGASGNVTVGLVCPTSDVSGGGVRIISPMEIQTGVELPLSLRGLMRAIGAKTSKSDTTGIVRRREEVGNQWAYGIQFDKLNGDIRREIMKWCLSGSWEEVPIVE